MCNYMASIKFLEAELLDQSLGAFVILIDRQSLFNWSGSLSLISTSYQLKHRADPVEPLLNFDD